MEFHLAARIRHVRSLGIPVKTWMVRADARELVHDLYPMKFPDPVVIPYGSFRFKASQSELQVATILLQETRLQSPKDRDKDQ